jgi:hypothetical protein
MPVTTGNRRAVVLGHGHLSTSRTVAGGAYRPPSSSCRQRRGSHHRHGVRPGEMLQPGDHLRLSPRCPAAPEVAAALASAVCGAAARCPDMFDMQVIVRLRDRSPLDLDDPGYRSCPSAAPTEAALRLGVTPSGRRHGFAAVSRTGRVCIPVGSRDAGDVRVTSGGHRSGAVSPDGLDRIR